MFAFVQVGAELLVTFVGLAAFLLSLVKVAVDVLSMAVHLAASIETVGEGRLIVIVMTVGDTVAPPVTARACTIAVIVTTVGKTVTLTSGVSTNMNPIASSPVLVRVTVEFPVAVTAVRRAVAAESCRSFAPDPSPNMSNSSVHVGSSVATV